MTESQSVINKSFIFPLPVCVLILDRDCVVMEASMAMFGLFHHVVDVRDNEGVRREMTSFLSREDGLSASIKNSLSKLNIAGKRDVFRWQNGRRIYNVTVSAFSMSEELLFAVLFEDQTEYFAIIQANERARGYLESIMASLHLGVIVTDRKLRVTNMNRTQEEFFKASGRTVSMLESVGCPIYDILPDEVDVFDSIASDILDSGCFVGGIREHFDFEGEEKTFTISFSPIKDDQNRIFGMIRVCEDITEKEKLEDDLRKAETRNLEIEAVRKVIVTLNHEINNALMSIMANAELLLRDTPSSTNEGVEMLETIITKACRIADVTQRLSSLEKLETREYLEGGPEMITTPELNPEIK